MLDTIRDLGRARRWLRLRNRIRGADTSQERQRLLRRFGEEIRRLTPTLAKKASTVEREDITRADEVAAAHGVVIGAWLQLDPRNPEWPGRDRLFVIRREDLINTCSALSTFGFFPVDLAAALVERVDTEGRKAVVPGLEAPGFPAEEIPELLWESALESGRGKRVWRERVGEDAEWVETSWRDMPAVWRSVAIFDAADPVTEQCRVLPGREGDKPAGLVALVKVGHVEAQEMSDSWTAAGWRTAVVGRYDSLGLYEALTSADMGIPFAVMLATTSASTRLHISKTALRRRESGLLGEMSDAQFNDLMGEFLGV